MIKRRTLIASAGLALLPWSAMANPTLFYGTWFGVLESGRIKMRLRFDIFEGPRAVLTSIDEGDDGQDASSVKINGDEIEITFAKIAGRYVGKRRNSRLEGTWHQGFQTLPLILTRNSVGPDTADAEPLDPGTLRRIRQKKQIPALGVGWCHAGSRPEIICDGVRSSEALVPVTWQDQWHWGSITKPLTATLVAVLVEKGVLSWDDTVEDILGRDAPDMQSTYRRANLLHLLSHRSGMGSEIPTALLRESPFEELADGRADRLRFTRKLLEVPPIGELGQRFVYANSGYIVAAAMIEACTGQAYEALMHRYLFEPLSLDSAGFGPPDPEGTLSQPWGHYEPDWTWKDGRARNPVRPGGKRPADNCYAFGPAGRAHMNLADMLRFLNVHATKAEALLPRSAWEKLHTPHFAGTYALGWEVRSDGSLWHNGSNTYWYAEVIVDPAEGVSAAAVANDSLLDVTQPVVRGCLASAWVKAAEKTDPV